MESHPLPGGVILCDGWLLSIFSEVSRITGQLCNTHYIPLVTARVLGKLKKRHEVDFGCRLGWEIDF